MSRTEDLLDKAVLLGLLVDQYSEQYYDESLTLYNAMIRRVSRILRPEYGQDVSASQRKRIIKEINTEIDNYRDSLRELARDQLSESANAVYDRQQGLITEVDPELNLGDKPDVTRGLFTQHHAVENGKTIQLDAMYATHINLLRSQLQDVVTRLSTIVEDEPVAQGYFTDITSRNQTNLNAVSLTSVALAASLAKRAFYSRNKKLFRGYQWVSVLDSRTTAYCQERHMKVWYYDDSENSTLPAEEHPPGHFRCRSQTTPIFQGDAPIDSPTFDEWFERQSDTAKMQILGPRRFELYKSGAIDITDVNTVRGQRRTLKELRDNG